MHRANDLLVPLDSYNDTLPKPAGLEEGMRIRPAAEPALPADRPLAALAPAESRRERLAWLGGLVVTLGLYAFALATFWAPADSGIDENAYLVGGKQLARTGSTRVTP